MTVNTSVPLGHRPRRSLRRTSTNILVTTSQYLTSNTCCALILTHYDSYYQAYIDFYTDLVRNKDISTILEEQIFDVKANFIGADKEPEMLNRFLDAIVHPMIHLGYGIEFGLPGMLVEGKRNGTISIQ